MAGLAKQLRAESAALAIIPSPEPPAEPKEGEEKATKEEASSPPPEETPATRGTALAAAAKGVVLGSFTDIRFKSEEKDKEGAGAFVKEFTFLFPGAEAGEGRQESSFICLKKKEKRGPFYRGSEFS